ncbi:MAG: hypothetical protein HQL44_13425 [Alphaproteobacteria bacterium]|nr:hypothetical protein [Alphaproteobacteria bacterium]
MSGKVRSKDKSAEQTEAKAVEAAQPPAQPTSLRQPNGPAEVLGHKSTLTPISQFRHGKEL